MTKKDITAIRKRYTKDKNNFSRIAGAYVNNEKQIVSTFSSSPVELDEEEFFKYLDVAKKSLSGKVGNSLLCLPYTSEERDSHKTQDFLIKLRDSELKDEDILNEFYQKIIDTYACAENYLIIVFSDTYDIPSKASDNSDLGESEYVYNYILTAICPVTLSKPGLGYREDEDRIGALIREWTAAPVESAFMYPAFSDGNGDLDHVTVYSKKPKEPHQELWTDMLHVTPRLSEIQKRNAFLEMVGNACDEDDYDEQMFNVADQLSALIDDKKQVEGEAAVVDISADEIEDVLSDAGFDEEKIKKVREEYDETFSSTADQPAAEELLDEKLLKNQKLYHENHALKREVQRLNGLDGQKAGKDSRVAVTVPGDKKNNVKIAEIEGVRCMVIPVDDDEDVTVNGEPV